MSEFDGGKFYGFSMKNNPNLITNTNNFDFQHLRREIVDKTIQNVHNKEDPNKQKNMWHNYCQLREATPKTKERIGTPTKDPDVETQMNTVIPEDTIIVRDLRDNEVENLIDTTKHKSFPSKISTTRCYSPNEGHDEEILQHKCPNKTNMSMTTCRDAHKYKMISSYKSPQEAVGVDQINTPSNCTWQPSTSNIHMVEHVDSQFNTAQTPQNIYNVLLEEHRRPQPKWVEIEEPSKRLEIDPNPTSPLTQSSHCNDLDFPTPAVLMTEVINDNGQRAHECINTTMQHNNNGGNVETCIVEDSDLELEFMHLPHYTKSPPKSNEMLNLSIADDNDRIAEFNQIESGMTEVDVQSFRTSMASKYEQWQVNNNGMKIYINGSQKQQFQNEHPTVTTESTKTPDRLSSPHKKQQQFKSEIKPSLRQHHLLQTSERRAGSDCTTKPTTSPHDRYSRSSTVEQSERGCASRTLSKCLSPDKLCLTNRMSIKHKNTSRRSPRSNNLVISKSIEDLKAEKTNIFKKMTATQGTIMEVLNKLRLSLLQLNVPENSHEKCTRQRNAIEFSVRFTRNFLYPLKGMKEELELTSDEHFNSLTSNQACNRVCNMYCLLLQSLNTYQKQLRYFLLDHVSQKLTTLIKMMSTITAICLEKNIFSKQDVIVAGLQQRCSEFLGFLEDIEGERLQVATQSHRKLTLDEAHGKYDLKMCMNHLNMYEPKLVKKVIVSDRSAKTKRSGITKRPINQAIVDACRVENPPEDTIPTHVQGISAYKSSGCSINSRLDAASGHDMPLDKNVIEALQNATEQQVRQVMEPILGSLGKQNNSEEFEAILNAVSVKLLTFWEAEKKRNIINKYASEREIKTVELSSVDSLENTCKSLKAAKQTKTLRQQSSHETLSKKRSSTTSTTGIIVDDDDNNDNANNNKNDSNNNANSKRNNHSSKRNSATYLRGASGGGGKRSSEANHMGETTTTTTNESVSKKINKSKKLMNEDQINEELRQNEDTQSGGGQRKNVIRDDFSTSDSDYSGHQQKLKKHLRPKTKQCLKSHDLCISTSQTLEKKIDHLKTPPLATSVTPSSLDNITNNNDNENDIEVEVAQIQIQTANNKSASPQYANKSPYNTCEDIEKSIEKEACKPDLHIDKMIHERNHFLELCSENLFYKNPYYAEPWKVFSSISERLLNDVLHSVANDFDVAVSNFVEDFVEDFLELETKT